MLPIKLRTGGPALSWAAGMTWVFAQTFLLMAGGFVAPAIRRMLGTVPAVDGWELAE